MTLLNHSNYFKIFENKNSNTMIISIGEIHSYSSGCNQSSTKNLYEINNLIGDIFKIKDKSFVTLLIEIINNPLAQNSRLYDTQIRKKHASDGNPKDGWTSKKPPYGWNIEYTSIVSESLLELKNSISNSSDFDVDYIWIEHLQGPFGSTDYIDRSFGATYAIDRSFGATGPMSLEKAISINNSNKYYINYVKEEVEDFISKYAPRDHPLSIYRSVSMPTSAKKQVPRVKLASRSDLTIPQIHPHMFYYNDIFKTREEEELLLNRDRSFGYIPSIPNSMFSENIDLAITNLQNSAETYSRIINEKKDEKFNKEVIKLGKYVSANVMRLIINFQDLYTQLYIKPGQINIIYTGFVHNVNMEKFFVNYGFETTFQGTAVRTGTGKNCIIIDKKRVFDIISSFQYIKNKPDRSSQSGHPKITRQEIRHAQRQEGKSAVAKALEYCTTNKTDSRCPEGIKYCKSNPTDSRCPGTIPIIFTESDQNGEISFKEFFELINTYNDPYPGCDAECTLKGRSDVILNGKFKDKKLKNINPFKYLNQKIIDLYELDIKLLIKICDKLVAYTDKKLFKSIDILLTSYYSKNRIINLLYASCLSGIYVWNTIDYNLYPLNSYWRGEGNEAIFPLDVLKNYCWLFFDMVMNINKLIYMNKIQNIAADGFLRELKYTEYGNSSTDGYLMNYYSDKLIIVNCVMQTLLEACILQSIGHDPSTIYLRLEAPSLTRVYHRSLIPLKNNGMYATHYSTSHNNIKYRSGYDLCTDKELNYLENKVEIAMAVMYVDISVFKKAVRENIVKFSNPLDIFNKIGLLYYNLRLIIENKLGREKKDIYRMYREDIEREKSKYRPKGPAL